MYSGTTGDRLIAEESSVIPAFLSVIPAQAGIQKGPENGFRIKCGMTCKLLLNFT
jgi:hypothetical protein